VHVLLFALEKGCPAAAIARRREFVQRETCTVSPPTLRGAGPNLTPT
jgi:hypothetical protein